MIRLDPDPDQVAADLVDAVGPYMARRIADGIHAQADRIERPRPYVGPSCDHPAGPGYVYFETLAAKDRMGSGRR